MIWLVSIMPLSSIIQCRQEGAGHATCGPDFRGTLFSVAIFPGHALVRGAGESVGQLAGDLAASEVDAP